MPELIPLMPDLILPLPVRVEFKFTIHGNGIYQQYMFAYYRNGYILKV